MAYDGDGGAIRQRNVQSHEHFKDSSYSTQTTNHGKKKKDNPTRKTKHISQWKEMKKTQKTNGQMRAKIMIEVPTWKEKNNWITQRRRTWVRDDGWMDEWMDDDHDDDSDTNNWMIGCCKRNGHRLIGEFVYTIANAKGNNLMTENGRKMVVKEKKNRGN